MHVKYLINLQFSQNFLRCSEAKFDKIRLEKLYKKSLYVAVDAI